MTGIEIAMKKDCQHVMVYGKIANNVKKPTKPIVNKYAYN
jgi:hypothetical protein